MCIHHIYMLIGTPNGKPQESEPQNISKQAENYCKYVYVLEEHYLVLTLY